MEKLKIDWDFELRRKPPLPPVLCSLCEMFRDPTEIAHAAGEVTICLHCERRLPPRAQMFRARHDVTFSEYRQLNLALALVKALETEGNNGRRSA